MAKVSATAPVGVRETCIEFYSNGLEAFYAVAFGQDFNPLALAREALDHIKKNKGNESKLARLEGVKAWADAQREIQIASHAIARAGKAAAQAGMGMDEARSFLESAFSAQLDSMRKGDK